VLLLVCPDERAVARERWNFSSRGKLFSAAIAEAMTFE
jgi:hypothetical protein